MIVHMAQVRWISSAPESYAVCGNLIERFSPRPVHFEKSSRFAVSAIGYAVSTCRSTGNYDLTDQLLCVGADSD